MNNLHSIHAQKELTNKQKAHIWYAQSPNVNTARDKVSRIWIDPDGSVFYLRENHIFSWYNDPPNNRAVMVMWKEAGKPEPKPL